MEAIRNTTLCKLHKGKGGLGRWELMLTIFRVAPSLFFQGEAKSEGSERYKNGFCSHAKKGFALSIVLKLTVFGTRKWSIVTAVTLWVNSEQAGEV